MRYAAAAYGVLRRSGRRVPSCTAHSAHSAQSSARQEGHRRLIKFTLGLISVYTSSSASLLPSLWEPIFIGG